MKRAFSWAVSETRARRRTGALLLSAGLTVGCGVARRPPRVPPTPTSVTIHEPGGDAYDPHAAALQRLLDEPWGRRRDRTKQLKIPLADHRHWLGTEFALLDEFAAFSYGDDYHALTAVFIRDAPTSRVPSAEWCLGQHADWMNSLLDSFGVEVTERTLTRSRWKKRSVFVGSAEAELDYGFGESRVSAGWAAYPAYSGACLVVGIAVFHRGQERLARQVRDRWTAESVKQLRTAAKERPVALQELPRARP